MEIHGLNFRNPHFDGPGDRRVLATIIGELERMISPTLDVHAAIRMYRDYRCRDQHERRIVGDLSQLLSYRLNLDHQLTYSGWLRAEHNLDARRDLDAFVRAQINWLDSIAQEFAP